MEHIQDSLWFVLINRDIIIIIIINLIIIIVFPPRCSEYSCATNIAQWNIYIYLWQISFDVSRTYECVLIS